MKAIQVGLIGLGTVGAGTFHVLQRNQAEIRGRAGRGIEIAMVAARNAERAKAYQAIVGDGVPCVGDAQLLVNNPAIEIVVELIGGIEPARSLVLQAIANGKHVVTANKALLAPARHRDLRGRAREGRRRRF